MALPGLSEQESIRLRALLFENNRRMGKILYGNDFDKREEMDIDEEIKEAEKTVVWLKRKKEMQKEEHKSKNLIDFSEVLIKFVEDNLCFLKTGRPYRQSKYHTSKYSIELQQIQELINYFDFVK